MDLRGSLQLWVLFWCCHLFSLSVSWAPVTHYFFSCTAQGSLDNGGSLQKCLSDTDSNSDLFIGDELPDSFFFGAFITGSSCMGFESLHSAVYAGYQVKLALNDAGTKYNDFNATALALGFGSHAVGDLSGFWSNGFLGNGFDNTTNEDSENSGLYNWIELWSYMTAVDALVYRSQSLSASDLTSLWPNIKLTSSMAAFLSEANNNWEESSVMLTEDDALNCAEQWNKVLQTEMDKVTMMPQSMYEFELQFNDQYESNGDIQKIEENFQLAYDCAVEAIQVWTNSILQPHTSPEQAYYQVLSWYTDAFNAGKCSPSS